MNCPVCANPNVRRSRRRGLIDKVKSWFGRRPYRCHTCMHRFFSSVRAISAQNREHPDSGPSPKVIGKPAMGA